MSKDLKLIVACLNIWLAVLFSGATGAFGEASFPVTERKITALLQQYGIPGASISLTRKGQILWSAGFGILDKRGGERVDSSTLFQAASISKTLTAYATLRLLSRKGISIDALANEGLKTWKIPTNVFTQERGVTIRHLLTHTGGFRIHGFKGYGQDDLLPSLTQILNGVFPAHSNPVLVKAIPGTEFSYSGGGISVLQQYLLDVARVNSFPELMKTMLLAPLQMSRSSFEMNPNLVASSSCATGHNLFGTPIKGKYRQYPEMAAAGLWSTSEDLARFLIEVQRAYEGDSLLLERSLATEMITQQFASTPAVGLGFFVTEKSFFHSGANAGFNSYLYGTKRSGDGIVILTNSEKGQSIFPKILEILRSEFKLEI